MATARRSRQRRSWVQRICILLLGITCVISALSAALLAYAKDTVSSIPRTAYGNILTEEETDVIAEEDSEPIEETILEPEVFNFFLIGTDSVANLPDDHRLRYIRSSSQLLTDTLIILRLDTGAQGKESDVSVISVPRDLWVPISGYGGEHQKINSLLAFTGPQTLVQTVRDYLAVPIHHVIQVDFNGFLELFKIIGGLDLYIEFPIKDEKAHLLIEETGCVSLTPEQGLGIVRSRTMLAFVQGEWRKVDTLSDLDRMDRQQDFLILSLQQAFDSGFRDPGKIRDVIEDVFRGGYLTLDDRMTPDDMIDLASRFRGFDANSLNKFTLPTFFDWDGPYSILRLIESEAQEVLDVFRGSQPEKSFGLTLLNGTGITGEASRIANELVAAGFRIAETGNAPSFDFERTTIYHDAVQEDSAMLLRSYLLSGADLVQREEETGKGIELIFGRDYSGVSDEQIDPESQEGITMGLSGQASEAKPLAFSEVDVTGDPVWFTDSVNLSSNILDEPSPVVFSTTIENEEQELQEAVQRAGQIRGC
ncbi:MAG: LCP family protein [Acidimicrobiales bacterium]|nr:LCP family protein [Acidimicrobiales bacterium]